MAGGQAVTSVGVGESTCGDCGYNTESGLLGHLGGGGVQHRAQTCPHAQTLLQTGKEPHETRRRIPELSFWRNTVYGIPRQGSPGHFFRPTLECASTTAHPDVHCSHTRLYFPKGRPSVRGVGWQHPLSPAALVFSRKERRGAHRKEGHSGPQGLRLPFPAEWKGKESPNFPFSLKGRLRLREVTAGPQASSLLFFSPLHPCTGGQLPEG